MDPYLIIFFIMTFSILLPITSGIIRRQSLKIDMALLLGLYVFMFIEEVATIYIYYGLKGNPYWLQHIYAPVEYGIVIVVFSIWIDNSIIKKALRISIPIYIIISVVTVLTFESIKDTNSFAALALCVVELVTSVYIIFILFTRDYGDLISNYKFWMCCGYLIFSSGSLIYFAFYDYLNSTHIWIFHNICNIIAHLFYAKGFLCLQRR